MFNLIEYARNLFGIPTEEERCYFCTKELENGDMYEIESGDTVCGDCLGVMIKKGEVQE